MAFKFNLGERVAIAESGESGSVIGRAEYSEAANSYCIRYVAGDGRAVESWWSEGALNSVADADGDEGDTSND
ncbi:hypothetical protein [Burkholderia multivorans]|uniref:hypothetical protein n=1 Tax=Burkholderia multivorans TaxID=87883 RepID=UPI0021BE6665|nr:hypothetical protein [Burkholderia multivorans]MDR9051731.1 hypothetical protein [Burkholderia multivorans]MDR9057731.1 hypothetical protein [Burkholderia multivorans]MDR9064642.1 hypothetical protein [Burkholderia multivorans]MDR9069747.1 hypothetical protein [Burkholderia multivorans]MDR9076827.1 hypothetical protein [Burkholderia multivorans]